MDFLLAMNVIVMKHTHSVMYAILDQDNVFALTALVVKDVINAMLDFMTTLAVSSVLAIQLELQKRLVTV